MLVLVLASATSVRAQEPASIEIGVLAFRGEAHTYAQFEPTAAYLGEAIPGHRFEIVPMTLQTSDELVGADRLDFVLTQPANYALLETRYGLTRIATMRNQTPLGPQTRFGAVIFVRADRGDLRTLDDLPGHSFMAIGPHGFGGYMMAEQVLVHHGIDPDDDLELEFCGFPQDQVVRAVRDGEVDVGTVRTHVLERMAAEGEIELDDFHVIAAREERGFPYLLSTPLYPEWAFAVARTTDPELAQAVAVALLSLSEDHPASRAADNAGWTVPLDYGPVHELLRELHEPPYETYGQVGAVEAMRQYWHVILIAILVTVVLLLGISRMSRLNAKLGYEIAERERAEHQLLASEKMASLGQLAAGVAHELNTPLAYIYSNEVSLARELDGLFRLLAAYEARAAGEDIAALREAVDIEGVLEDVPAILRENAEGLQRMKAIVAGIKTFSHVGVTTWERASIAELVEHAVAMLRGELDAGIEIECALDPSLEIECLPAQLERAFLNLLVNARDAAGAGGTIRVHVGARGESELEVGVADDGPGIEPEHRARIFDPFFTTKEIGAGTGLGLAIALRIVEAHGGRIEVDSDPGAGATFRVLLPRRRASGPGGAGALE